MTILHSDLHRRSAADIGRMIMEGLDPVEVTEFFLERIGSLRDEPVFITVTADRARSEAKLSRERHAEGRALGPLDGVPIAWKDLIDVAGTRTTAGSALRRDVEPASIDAPIVRHAAAAGLVTLGKTNLTEFAYSALGLNPHFGTPANPHDRTVARVPGGSSSGSAVAVARGLAPLAIGSDTGGSIRMPAAFCGLIGYKSSEGRWPKEGVVPLSSTLDTIGPLARSVEDCILLDSLLRGRSPSLPSLPDLSDLALLVPENRVLDALDDAVSRNFETSLASLQGAGVRIIRRPLSLLDDIALITERHGTLAAAEAYAHYRDTLEGPDVGQMDCRVAKRMMMGKAMTSDDIAAIEEARHRLAGQLVQELRTAFLAMPTIAHTAPEIAPLEADDDLFQRANQKTNRNASIGNFLGTPGIALPNGVDDRGLPTSFLLSAVAQDDDRLLAAGQVIEAVIDAAKSFGGAP